MQAQATKKFVNEPISTYNICMDTATQVLVIIVSAVLAVFLIFAIVATVYIIKIVKRIKQITDHAENVAESMESAASAFRRTATPLAFLKLLSGIIENATRVGKRKG